MRLFPSGGHGILCRHFPQVIAQLHNTTKRQYWPGVTRFWIALVICGCLALIGIKSSTISAQWAVPFLAGAAVSSQRRQGQRRGPQSSAAASYARYSSDMQDTTSIDQQQRRCQEKAAANGHTISPDLQFADEAISGTKRKRAGLTAMLDAAREGKFSTLYFDCLSRLARDLVITLSTLKELVYSHHVRFISVTEGIDSDTDNWELNAVFRGWMHQEYIKTLRETVMRGKNEAVLNDWSVGDYCFGYASEPIPGTENTRRGRQKGARKRVIVDEVNAGWVRKVFSWFVYERKPIQLDCARADNIRRP